jgi:hypothetical protein
MRRTGRWRKQETKNSIGTISGEFSKSFGLFYLSALYRYIGLRVATTGHKWTA